MIPVVFALAIALAAALGEFVVHAGALALPTFWPPSGVLLAALLISERRRWPLLVAIAWIVSTLVGMLYARPLSYAVIVSTVFSAEALVAAAVLRRTLPETFTLNRVTHTWFLVLATTAVTMAGGLVAARLLPHDGWSFVVTWRAWWLGDTIGVLLVAPLALTVPSVSRRTIATLRSWHGVELLVGIVGAAIMAQGVFGDLFGPLMGVPAYVLPFLLWPAFRGGPGGSAWAVFLVCLLGIWNTSHGHGPFAMPGGSPDAWILRAQGAIGMASVSLLLVASVVAERHVAAQERVRLVDDLQLALTEIKTLRGLIPICAWCHKVRDDADVWQRLETYLGEHTDATFSHSICPACIEKQQHIADTDSPGVGWKI